MTYKEIIRQLTAIQLDCLDVPPKNALILLIAQLEIDMDKADKELLKQNDCSQNNDYRCSENSSGVMCGSLRPIFETERDEDIYKGVLRW